ncbi:MAG: hypothetical protein A2284_07835 [Deltaproteobacteria bacterium RIFOXYA12_FULL_61_11]|nr:MAG: hypothetical protein A2284_07835 [Deltaproteobacteria bacterium RIFOXYA12_FULL_61_11]
MFKTLAIMVLACMVVGFEAQASRPTDKGAWYSATPMFWDQGAKLLDAHGLQPLEQRPTEEPRVGQVEQFYTMNVAKSTVETTSAVLRAIGNHCYLYVEEGSDLGDQTVERLRKNFDEKIYPTNHRYFGSEWKPGIDWDERVTLLFLDIKDGWTPGKGYVGGYFSPVDEFSKRIWPTSNEREMVYLDTYPSDPDSEDFLGILAHEFQHMIHFNADPRETVWLNEAMAQIAFYVNGFGHAPQIMGFLGHNQFSLEKFKENGVFSYGYVYLWMYYLMTKYFGDDAAEQAETIKRLVASKKQGLDSIAEVLTERGVQKPLSTIFFEFAKANLYNDQANPFLGYDQSLPVRVQPARVHALGNLPAKAVEVKLAKLTTSYFSFLDKVRYLPVNPTMLDRIAVFADAEQGVLAWDINDGQLPPEAIIPAGSKIEGTKVLTPVKAIEGGHGVVLGPFTRLGVAVHRVNARFILAGAMQPEMVIPVYTMDKLSKPKAETVAAAGGQFRLDLTVKGSPLAALFVVLDRGESRELRDIPLQKGKARFELPLDPTVRGLHFGLAAFDGKKVSLEYKSVAREDLEASSASSAALRPVKAAKVEEEAPAAAVESRGAATARMSKLAERTARETRMVSKDNDSARLVDELLAFAEAEDPAHDNMGYRIAKKAELVHGLTHLQISPQWEQLLKLWKLLELLKGFPHLPLPDGFAIKDFDEAQTLSVLKHWADAFAVPYPFEKEFGPINLDFPKPKIGTEAEVKEALLRMTMCEAILEFAYNNGLTLASDTALTVYEFARFIWGVKMAVGTIAAQFGKVPVVGIVVKKLTNMIQAKLLNVVQNFAYFISNKLASPANLWVPILVSYAVNIYARVMDIEYEPEPLPGFENKEMVIGLFGSFVLASVPKIGMVARSQKALDLHTKAATALDVSGTYQQAVKKLIDDGDPTGFGSVRETIVREVTNRHQLSFEERRIARIGTRLTEVFQLAAVIDPTHITKILAIAAGVATSGVLVHSTYTTFGYLMKVTGKGMQDATQMAFHPDRPLEQRAEVSPYSLEKPNLQSLAQTYSSMGTEFDRYLALLEKGVGREDDIQTWADKLETSDLALDNLMSASEAMTLAADPENQDLFAASQDLHGQRAMALSAVMEQALDQSAPDIALIRSEELRGSVERYLGVLRQAREHIVSAKLDSHKVLHLEAVTSSKSWTGTHTVNAIVRNRSRSTLQKVEVQLLSGLTFDLKSARVQVLEQLKPGEAAAVQWKFKLSGYDRDNIALKSVTVISAAEGTPIASRVATIVD